MTIITCFDVVWLMLLNCQKAGMRVSFLVPSLDLKSDSADDGSAHPGRANVDVP
jgi:hypothetical protein